MKSDYLILVDSESGSGKPENFDFNLEFAGWRQTC